MPQISLLRPLLTAAAFVWTLLLWGAIGLLTIVASLTILLVNLLVGLIDRKRRLAHWIASCWGVLALRCNPLWRVRVIGRHHIPSRRAVIFVSNHQSMLDIMAGFLVLHQFKWVAKQELFGIPLFGWAVAGAGYIRLARGENRSIRESYAQARRWVESGVSVFFFPEGTRSRTGELGAFKSGAFKLAVDTGTPVVPVAIAGTRDLLKRGSWLFNPVARVQVTVLAPLSPAGEHAEPDRLRDAVRDAIARTLQHHGSADTARCS